MPSLRDALRTFTSNFYNRIFRRARREITIFRYEVRISGWVEPPKMKKSAKEKTALQWEISFEGRARHYRGRTLISDYFRTTIGDRMDAMKRFEFDLEDLVKKQESNSTNKYAFSFKADEVSFDDLRAVLGLKEAQKFVEEFLPQKDQNYYEKTQMIRKPAQPTLHVEAFDFEPVDSFKIDPSQLKQGMADDKFFFKVYRSEEEHATDEFYILYQDEFEHPLM